MDLTIKVTKCNVCTNCKLTVQDQSTYLDEDNTSTVKGKFKFSDVILVDAISLNKTTETVYKSTTFTTDSKIAEIPIYFDGWLTISHVALPSSTWFNTELSKESGSALGLYTIVYYTDGTHIYKYINGTSTEVDIEEVLEANTDVTTVSITTSDFVSICYLRKCYINLCQQIFNSRGFNSCWNKNNIDSELIYKRDLVWMAINVIKYLVECKLLAEAERIIEIINGCNGICSNNNSSKSSGCGCKNA